VRLETIAGLALLGWFSVMAIAEVVLARGAGRENTGDGRLFTNFGLTIASLIMGNLLPAVGIVAALSNRTYGLGLAQQVAIPWAVILLLTLILQSLAYYWVHRLMHAVPLTWRFHRVHHADSALDVSSSLRNHPLELLLTVPASVLVVLALGAPVSIVVAANAIFIAAAILQHADIRLPDRVERSLAPFIMTPRLHRLHHSTEERFHESNYGNLITLWDWLFGTLRTDKGDFRVGLDGQPRRGDNLWDQICSPLYIR
jgi:sterol desaturase/sphingolipid hydroxylase (fatty acid hydroxylase superfamily)